MIGALLTRSIDLLAPATSIDAYGNTVREYATTTTVRGWLHRIAASDDLINRDAEIGDWILVLPAGTTITGDYRVQVDDVTYEIVGAVYTAHTPTGPHHIEARLKVVDG